MTRDKLPPGTVLQKAYGVLDKYKLSRTFFVKTDQNSCEIAEAQQNDAVAASTTENANSASSTGTKKPGKKGSQKKGAQTTGRDESTKKPEIELVVDVKQSDSEVVADQKIETTTV